MSADSAPLPPGAEKWDADTAAYVEAMAEVEKAAREAAAAIVAILAEVEEATAAVRRLQPAGAGVVTVNMDGEKFWRMLYERALRYAAGWR